MQIQGINQQANYNNQNFKGYTNIVSNKIYSPIGNTRLTYISMLLNDIGHKDLQKWHCIQKKLFEKEPISDIITIEDFTPECDDGIFGGVHFLPPDKHPIASEKGKGLMEFYTLAASLTKRIMGEKSSVKNSSIKDVMVESVFNIKGFFQTMQDAIKAVNTFEATHCSPQENASIINKSISRIMEDYLEC